MHAALVDEFPGQFQVYGYQNLLVSVRHGPATLEGARHTSALFARRFRELQKRFSIINLMEMDASLGLPDPAARAEYVAMRSRHAHEVGCVAVVIGYGGLWGSAMRGLINSFVTLAPQPYPLKLVSRLDEAAAWLPQPHARSTGVSLDPRELAQFLESVQAARSLRRRTQSAGAAAP